MVETSLEAAGLCGFARATAGAARPLPVALPLAGNRKSAALKPKCVLDAQERPALVKVIASKRASMRFNDQGVIADRQRDAVDVV
jgi:hypothetical protein